MKGGFLYLYKFLLSLSSLCFYPQNRLFFGQTVLAALLLSPKPPVFRTNRSRRFASIPKTACFSDKPFSPLYFYPQKRLFFGQTVLAALLFSPKPPVFRTNHSHRFAFLPKTACFSDKPFSPLCFYPQNRLFFGQTVLGCTSQQKVDTFFN